MCLRTCLYGLVRLSRAAAALLVVASTPIGNAQAQWVPETLGWTDRDRQFYGPALRFLVHDTIHGTHAVWKTGYGEIRYNHSPRNGRWRWPQGTVVNSFQRNLGCLDIDVRNGWVYVSADFRWRGRPVISYFTDSAPGAGRFRETGLAYDLRHNLVGASDRGYPKFAALSSDSIYYYGFFGGMRLGEVGPFPAHNLAVSKQSGRFGYIWATNQGPNSSKLYLKQTPNNGANWYATVSLSDSVPSSYNRSLLGADATYDSIRIHLVADFYDGSNPLDVVFWHYCPYNSPPWHVVLHITLPEGSPLGSCNLAACRPSIGMDRRRRELYLVWEQFDPENIDPRTGLCRADIWACRSCDDGATWGPPIRLTEPDSTSRRFPCLAEVVDDTLRILYFGDRIAGVWEHGEGEQTINPVLFLKVPAAVIPTAVRESESGRIRWTHTRGHSLLGSSWTIPGLQRVVVADVTGRVLFVREHPKSFGQELAPGIYFGLFDTGSENSGYFERTVVRLVKTP